MKKRANWIAAYTLSGIALLTSSPSHATDFSAIFAMQQSLAATVSPYQYADLAAPAERATLIADARIRSATKMNKAFAGADGKMVQRLYVEAEINSLIRGNQALAKRVSYMVDIPLDSRGKLPKLKKQRVLIFAKPVEGKPGVLQLVAPNAQLIWDSSADATVRSVTTELLNTNAPPAISGVESAFHAAGTLEGEGDTQIFLGTRTGDPASLAIVTRPGLEPRWSVAFGEVVGESAQVPQKDTLAWYRLACGLPESIPISAFEGNHEDRSREIMRDYAFVRQQLGPCPRALPAL